MTTPTEKEEHVRIYEEIKQRRAVYEAAHPGRYYLLSDEEMDDISSAAMEQMFEAKRQCRAQQASPG